MNTNRDHLAHLFEQSGGKFDASALPEVASLEQVTRLLSIDPTNWHDRPDVARALENLLWSPRFKPLHSVVWQANPVPTLPLVLGVIRTGRAVEDFNTQQNRLRAEAEKKSSASKLADVTGVCIEHLKPFRDLLTQEGAAPDTLNFLFGPKTSPTPASFERSSANLPVAPKVSPPTPDFSPRALEICRALGFSGTTDEKSKKSSLLSKILGNPSASGFSAPDVERAFANLDKQPALKAGRGLYFVLPTISHLTETLFARPPGKHLRQVSNG